MKRILEEFVHIIIGVESSLTVEKYGFKFSKMKLRLIDGSSLTQVRQIILKKSIKATKIEQNQS